MRKTVVKQKDETEIMFKKFLGYTMQEMQEAAANTKKWIVYSRNY